MGLEGSYTKEEVAPEKLHSFVSTLSERGLVGCNVTIPHKEPVFRLVRVDDELTRVLGAVNTIFISDRQTFGINTDGYGFVANLARRLPGFEFAGKSVLLLGSGGAARAIAGTLLHNGVARIMLANRTAGRAERLRDIFGARVAVVSWHGVENLLAETDLLINTTSLGMKGEPELVISLARLPRPSAVCDIVYVPLETALLHQAREHGNPVVDGLGMLLHQAQPGFEKWFGVRPEVTIELRRLVEDDIEREMNVATGRP
jgi:shikimate dehydrogenase